MSTTRHFIEDQRKRTAFWSMCSGLHLDREAVLDILGAAQNEDGQPLAEVRAWSGTLKDALDALQSAAADAHADDEGDAPLPPAENDGTEAIAQSEEMPPERLELQERLYDAVSAGRALSPVSATTIVRTRKGGHWMTTIRAGMPEDMMIEAMRSLVRCIDVFESAVFNKSRGWLQVYKTNEIVAFGEGSVTSEFIGTSTSPGGSSRGRRQRAESSEPPVEGYTRVRVGRLRELVCKRSGRFEFSVQGLQHPLVDNRGAEVVSRLFAPECWAGEFGAATLTEGRNLEQEDFGQLSARYGKNERGYWDVIAVFPTPG